MSKSEHSGCFTILLQILGLAPKAASADGPLPYRTRDDFLSAAEISFYHVLCSALDERWTVCPKVNLGDLFFVTEPQKNVSARNRIASKHVDFVVCERDTMKPRLGIELDDASHRAAKRQERDTLVDGVFAAASLPLARFPAQSAYPLSEIVARLNGILGLQTTDESAEVEGSPSPKAPAEPLPETGEPAIPQCPKCGIPMVRRDGPRGVFFGCSNFPKCRVTAN